MIYRLLNYFNNMIVNKKSMECVTDVVRVSDVTDMVRVSNVTDVVRVSDVTDMVRVSDFSSNSE